MAKQVYTFSQQSARRIASAVRRVEAMQLDLRGRPNPPRLSGGGGGAPPASGIWARITSRSSIGGNRWEYEAVQVFQILGPNQWTLEFDSWSGKAFNTLEAGNTSGGVTGSGDDPSNFQPGIALQPIGVGAVVWGHLLPRNPVPNPPVRDFYFSCPNNPGGRCEEE